MTRRRSRSMRFLVALAAGLALMAVVAATASALAFSDDSCDNTKPCRPPTGVVGSPYSFTLKAMPDTGNGPPYSFVLISGSPPPGLTLSSAGPITGTPTQAGSWVFGVELRDKNNACLLNFGGENKCAQRDFTISVDPGLKLVTNDLPQNATIGVPYSAPLQAQVVTNLNPVTGYAPTQPVTWSIVSGFGNGLPPGLSLGAADGVITGTPTTEGTYSFRVQVAIDPTRTSFQTYSLTVRQPLTVTPSRPLSTPPAPTLWEVGVPFNAKLTPSGGNGTYTVALAEGALPVGLAVAADGTISGTPSTAGVSRATIRVTDGEGRTLDYAVGFGVAKKLAIATRALKPGKVGKLYRSKLTTTGGLPPKTWRAVSGKFPKGVRLDRALGVLSGIPRKAGSYKVTFEARDGLKVTAQKTLRIIVAP